MTIPQKRRFSGAAILAAFSLLLSGCFIMPGKFTSELALKQNGEFTFTYDGEIHFLGLSKLAQMGAREGDKAFTAVECYDDDDFETRDCTEAELTEQRAEWDAGAEQRAKEAEEQAKQMAAMMGGIDPTDPEAGFKLEQLLLRHKGWESVNDKGDGMYDVKFASSGMLTHDMMFPVIEGFARNLIFVEAIVRDDGIVRVNAPGFAPPTENSMMSGMMAGMGGLGALAMMAPEGSKDEMPQMPVVDGTFTIVTDGQILANNTDEGPTELSAGKALIWEIDTATKSAPTALIKLTP